MQYRQIKVKSQERRKKTQSLTRFGSLPIYTEPHVEFSLFGNFFWYKIWVFPLAKPEFRRIHPYNLKLLQAQKYHTCEPALTSSRSQWWYIFTWYCIFLHMIISLSTYFLAQVMIWSMAWMVNTKLIFQCPSSYIELIPYL